MSYRYSANGQQYNYGGGNGAGAGVAAAIATAKNRTPTNPKDAGGSPPPLREITDPMRLGDSHTRPEDYNADPPTPTEIEASVIKVLDARVRAASDARKQHEIKWTEGLRFFLGDQWIASNNRGKIVDTREVENPDRVYNVINKIEPNIRKIVTRAVSARASWSVSPLTGMEQDINCATEARSVGSHLEKVNRWEEKLTDAYLFAASCGPVFSYVWPDYKAKVPFPLFDPQTGELSEVVDAPVGEINIDLVYWHEVLIDPNCRNGEDDCEYMIIRRRMAINVIKNLWPERGAFIVPEGRNSSGVSWATNEIDEINLNQNVPQDAEQYAWVEIHFEQPGPLYPNGRYMVKCQGKFLEPIRYEWPYKSLCHPYRRDRYLFPLTPLMYKKAQASFWGDNGVTPARHIQKTINRLVSRIDERSKNGDGKILAPRGSNFQPDAFRTGVRNEIVEWDASSPLTGGHKPEFMATPPYDPTSILLLDKSEQYLADVMEVQDVSKGQVPYAGAPAAAIMALLDADASSSALFMEYVKAFVTTTITKALLMAQEMYDHYRLLYVQDTSMASKMRAQMPALEAFDQVANPDQELEQNQPWTMVMDYKKFSRGRFVVSPSVSPPKSPAARAEAILNFARAGLLTPENIPMAIILLEALQVTYNDKATSDLLTALKRYEARQDQVRREEAMLAAAQSAGQGDQRMMAEQRLTEQRGQVQQQTNAQKFQLDMAKMKAQAQIGQLEAEANANRDFETQVAEQTLMAKTGGGQSYPDGSTAPVTRRKSGQRRLDGAGQPVAGRVIE